MRSSTRFLLAGVVSFAVLAFFCRPAISAELFVGSTQLGGFYGPYLASDDPPGSFPIVPPPDNSAFFQNYFMGRTSTAGLTFTTSERRVFFLYDMAGVAASIPVGEEVVGVAIDLELLFGGVLANFATGDVEVVKFTSTTATVDEILDPAGEGVMPEDVWATLGTGDDYGMFEIFDAGAPMPTLPGSKVIPLPGAVDDVKTAIDTSTIMIVSARLETYDPDPIGPTPGSPIDPYEFVFGLTDVVSGSPSVDVPDLILTTAIVPEPSSLFLALLAAAGAAFFWRRRGSV